MSNYNLWDYKGEANDLQIGGKHYKNNLKFEVWDLAYYLELTFIEATIIKYVVRLKNPEIDILKSIHYTYKQMQLMQDESKNNIFLYNLKQGKLDIKRRFKLRFNKDKVTKLLSTVGEREKEIINSVLIREYETAHSLLILLNENRKFEQKSQYFKG